MARSGAAGLTRGILAWKNTEMPAELGGSHGPRQRHKSPGTSATQRYGFTGRLSSAFFLRARAALLGLLLRCTGRCNTAEG